MAIDLFTDVFGWSCTLKMEGETKQPTNSDTHNLIVTCASIMYIWNSLSDKLRKQTKMWNLESFREVNVKPHVMQHTKIFKVNMLHQ